MLYYVFASFLLIYTIKIFMKWTENDKKIAIDNLKNGLSYKEISVILNRTYLSVKAFLKKNGFFAKDFYNEKYYIKHICKNCEKEFKYLKSKGNRKFCNIKCMRLFLNLGELEIKNNKEIINYTYEQVNDSINNTISMSGAARFLNIDYRRFKKISNDFGLFKINQGRRGLKRDLKEYRKSTIPIEDIIYNGLYPKYNTNHLKHRLFNLNIKSNICEICGNVGEWNGKSLTLQLDHIDGNSCNHLLSNLRILCPNCHCQTETYGSKNKNTNTYNDIDVLKALLISKNYTDLKIELRLSKQSSNGTLSNILTKYDVTFGDIEKLNYIIYHNEQRGIAGES